MAHRGANPIDYLGEGSRRLTMFLGVGWEYILVISSTLYHGRRDAGRSLAHLAYGRPFGSSRALLR